MARLEKEEFELFTELCTNQFDNNMRGTDQGYPDDVGQVGDTHVAVASVIYEDAAPVLTVYTNERIHQWAQNVQLWIAAGFSANDDFEAGDPSKTIFSILGDKDLPSLEETKESIEAAGFTSKQLGIEIRKAIVSLNKGDKPSTSNSIVGLATRMLELISLGSMVDQDVEDIYKGTDGFNQELLSEILTKTKEDALRMAQETK